LPSIGRLNTMGRWNCSTWIQAIACAPGAQREGSTLADLVLPGATTVVSSRSQFPITCAVLDLGGTIYLLQNDAAKQQTSFRVSFLPGNIAFGSDDRLYVAVNSCGGYLHTGPRISRFTTRPRGVKLARSLGIEWASEGRFKFLATGKRFWLTLTAKERPSKVLRIL
jgi:hypothetical protein